MGASGTMGWEFKLAMKAGSGAVDFSSGAEGYPFLSESLAMSEEFLDANGARGSRSHYANRTRQGNQTVGGAVVLHVTPGMLAALLPRVMGGSTPGQLAETLQVFGVLIDRGPAVFRYDDVQVNQATLRGQAGGLVELELDLWGRTENKLAAGTFPAITLTEAVTDQPLCFTDGAFNVGGTLYAPTAFEVVINNALVRRFANSTNATAINPGDRIVTSRLTLPWTPTEAPLYASGIAGTAVTIALTNGTVGFTIDLPAWQVPRQTPVFASRNGETFLTLAGTARRTALAAEITITPDAAP